ncbi:MAG: UpxY family transcription antiterminator [Kiritimatiellae bacterium]|nr:UpxY family transcription antiterminator [Kiritimatiellia bacterium]
MERRAWYVLHVKPRTEKKVNDFLAALRVFHYLPLLRKETRVQRRKVVRFLPVFPGYVFTRLSHDERAQVFGTRNIVRTISVAQPRLMIHQLRQVEHARRMPVDLRLVESFSAGEYVKVVSGPLCGLKGQVRRVGNSATIVLSVDILGRAVEASVDLRDVKHLES